MNASSFSPGDSVLLKRGEEWWETLIVPSSGTSGSSVTFGAYGSGNKPIIYSSDAYRYNHSSLTAYDKSGLGHRQDRGFILNGDFAFYSGDDFNTWGETVTGDSTVTVDNAYFYTGTTSAKLTMGTSGQARISQDVYFIANQKYEVSFWAKSDGVGSAVSRFYRATNGLADTKTNGIYQTWTTYANISDLGVSSSDTTWTEKKIIIQVDNASRMSTFQITNYSGSGTVWIDNVRIRPLWVNYSGDTWSAPYVRGNTGTLYMVSVNGTTTKIASDINSVNSSNLWFYQQVGGSYEYVLYVYSPNGDPGSSGQDVELMTTTNSKTIDLNDKNFIALSNLQIKNGYFGISNGGAGITIDSSDLSVSDVNVKIDSSNFTLQNSTITYGDWMIKIDGNTDNVLIRNNSISGARKFLPTITNEGGGIASSANSGQGDITNLIIEGNTVYDCESYGIAEYGDGSTGDNIIGAIYRKNKIYDTLYGFWSMSLSNGITGSNVYYNSFYSPKSGTSRGLRLYRPGNSVNFYNNSISGFTYGFDMWNSANSGLLKNNNIYNSGTYNIYDSSSNSTGIFNYNDYYPGESNKFSFQGNNTLSFSNWQTNSSQDANSITTDPLFVNSTGNYSTTTDFILQPLSPAIDSGTSISGLTTDYAGNPIYGTPDIGAYEYQPPFTFSLNDIPTTGSARLYSDGKYRMTAASSTASVANFSVTPLGGSYYTASTSQYMDITINTWDTTGDKNKQWTATSTAGTFLTQATSTIYTIGDLASNSYYQFKLDGSASTTAVTGATCVSGTCLSDSSGNLTFTYAGGYSTHIFGLEKDVTAPSAFTLSSPSDNSGSSNSRPTLSWNASTDSESGLNKYQLYIDGVLNADNISNSATSATPTNNSLSSCGNHTWYVRAIDNAGNATNSLSYTLKMICEGAIIGNVNANIPTPVFTVIQGMASSASMSFAEQSKTPILSITDNVLTPEQKQEKITEIKNKLIELINQLLALLRQKLAEARM